MQQILAIALLSIRNAIRSKMVISLLFLLIMVIVIIPLSIKGDGTMSGLIQVLLSYTLGLSVFILTLTSLWAGSASVSAEINNKTIQMVATKPVSAFQIWIGKWLGLCALNILLLTICGVVTYGMLHWHVRKAHDNKASKMEEAERLLTARLERLPTLPDVEKMARERLNAQLARQPLPDGTNREQVLNNIRQQIQLEYHTVRPAGQKRWEFPSIPIYGSNTTFTLQYKFSSSIIGHEATKGRWLIGTPERPDILDIPRDSVPRAMNELTFTVDQRWSGQPFLLTYIDMDPVGASLIFDFQNGLVLLTPEGGFVPNYLRTLLIMLGQVAFFTALGVATGSLFSLPVAAFVSIFLLVMIQMGSYIQGVAQTEIVWPWRAPAPEEATPLLTITITIIFRGMAFVMSPLLHESALSNISTGRLVDYFWVFRGFFLQGILYSLALGWLSSQILKRRELALPHS